MAAIGLGFRALRGGSVVVGVELTKREPRVVHATFLATAAEGDRLALEPYHVACEMPRGPEGAATPEMLAAVEEGRRRQNERAAAGLATIVTALGKPVVAALLVNRAGWMDDLLAYSLAFADHPPVAEGLAVRDALRFAFSRCAIEVVELDEKSLLDRGAKDLHATEARLKALGASHQPWRKEQRLACLAAWIAVG